MRETTPAPWFDDGYRIHGPTDSVDKRDGEVIAEYKHCDATKPGDGPLMAAAPDLLKALQSIADYFGRDAVPGELRFSDAANFASFTIDRLGLND